MDKTTVWIVLGALAAVYLVKGAAKDVAAAAGDVGDAVNPTSPDNLIYRGVNQFFDVLGDGQDNDSFNLGSWLYDITHPGEA